MDNQKRNYMQESRAKNVPETTVSRDMLQLSKPSGNVYETLMVIARRSNQISQDIKESLQDDLMEFASAAANDQSVADTVENQEQISRSREYERIPKSTLIATREYELGELHYEYKEDNK